jgi:hypothetical protein
VTTASHHRRGEQAGHLVAQVVGREIRRVDQDRGAAAAAGPAGPAPARCRWRGRRRAPADGGGGFRNSAAAALRHRSRDTANPPPAPGEAARRSYSATSLLAEKSRLRASVPSASDRSGGGPSSRRGSRLRGRLSIASKPRSSSALIAVVRPAPDGPVTNTTRGRRWRGRSRFGLCVILTSRRGASSVVWPDGWTARACSGLRPSMAQHPRHGYCQGWVSRAQDQRFDRRTGRDVCVAAAGVQVLPCRGR